MVSNPPPTQVLVVGAGASGLLLALLLAQQGVHVELLDQDKALDQAPRATHYAPPAVYELRRAGVLDEVRKRGFDPRAICWRKLDGTYLAGFDGIHLQDHPDRLVCLGLADLRGILLRALEAQSTATIHWDHKVTGIGQDDNAAWVDVITPDGNGRRSADYIVGCDGANSQIRRSLFGDMAFPGKTWDEQIVATNTYYDFDAYGYEDSNFIIDREHWHMAARISKDGMWRVTYGEMPGLSHEQLRERQPMKFKAMLPGHPTPDQYNMVNFSPYRIHQRLAEKMRSGRFLLAADAAHLCNPFGGMGLTGGIVDVGGLYDCLIGVISGQADDAILDKYSEIRREKYRTMIDPISSQNLLRLFTQDPNKAMQDDEFLRAAAAVEKDPEKSREFQLGVNNLKYDFTQHYHSEARTTQNGTAGNGKDQELAGRPTANGACSK